jgi:hypothetical protein
VQLALQFLTVQLSIFCFVYHDVLIAIDEERRLGTESIKGWSATRRCTSLSACAPTVPRKFSTDAG